MVIGIDGNEANITNRVGVNKYAFEIIRGIHDLTNEVEQGAKQLIVIVYLKDQPLPDMPKENSNFKYKVLSGRKVWILTRLTPHLLFTKNKPDVFFTPSHYVPPISLIPRVCSIMDLGYLEFSAQFTKYDYWQLKLWSAWSISVSKYIMTISNATKEDIIRRYPASKDKIVVTHPGVDEDIAPDKVSKDEIERVKSKYSIVNNYLLYLGTLKPSKNIEGLVEAWGKIVNKYPGNSLVIGGKKGWLYESIFEKVKKEGLENKVIFTDFVAEKDKLALIKGAKVFIIPSFWEGFGIDVLTAFALGVPVIASKAGSLPEVVGDAGLLIDPYNTNDIASAIEKILNIKKSDYDKRSSPHDKHSLSYDKMVKMQKMQLQKFSWRKATQTTLETLKKAVNV